MGILEIIGGILLIGLLALAWYLVPIALSTIYAFRGKLENDQFMIVLANGGLIDIILNSPTASFIDTANPVNHWEIIKDLGGGYEAETTFKIGFWPVYQAQKVFIPINTVDVIRPVKQGDKITYKLTERSIFRKNPSRFITHGFETAPVETKGGSGKIGDCEISKTDDLVAIITLMLQVRIEIFNPYLACVEIPCNQEQNFMMNVNGTLQSVARQVTAEFTYNEIIKAKVETEEADTEVANQFGARFKKLANANLKKYGVRINDVDLLDHSLDKDMEEALQAPQKAFYRAQETIANAQAKKEEKELIAEGDAAELKEILKAVGGDKRLAEIEINRRGLQRAAEGVGKSFPGQFLTVNFGGANNQSGPAPTVTVGDLQKKDGRSGNRPYNRGDKKPNRS